MQLTIQLLDSAPADSRAMLEGIAADLGLVPNLAAIAGNSPALLAGFDGLRRAVAPPSSTPFSGRSPGWSSVSLSTTTTASRSTRRCSRAWA